MLNETVEISAQAEAQVSKSSEVEDLNEFLASRMERAKDKENFLYFVDYRVLSVPRWIRSPLLGRKQMRRVVQDVIVEEDFADLRVSVESDLSKLITTEEGVTMTRRQAMFGLRYQEIHDTFIDDLDSLRKWSSNH